MLAVRINALQVIGPRSFQLPLSLLSTFPRSFSPNQYDIWHMPSYDDLSASINRGVG